MDYKLVSIASTNQLCILMAWVVANDVFFLQFTVLQCYCSNSCVQGLPNASDIQGLAMDNQNQLVAPLTELRIFPNITFRCNGSIVGWSLAAVNHTSSGRPELSVWRSNGTNQYIKVAASLIAPLCHHWQCRPTGYRYSDDSWEHYTPTYSFWPWGYTGHPFQTQTKVCATAVQHHQFWKLWWAGELLQANTKITSRWWYSSD